MIECDLEPQVGLLQVDLSSIKSHDEVPQG